MSRTIIIGDLHGCWEETQALLKKLDVTVSDRLIFLGDLIDRGPENAKCCDLVRRREQTQGSVACLLGNHEQTHLDHEHDITHRGLKVSQIPPSHLATRQQLKPEHYAWFRQMPLFIKIPEFNIIAVHAGVYPGRPIEAQEARHLLHIQCIQPFDKNGQPTYNTKSKWPSRIPSNEDGWSFWTKFYNGSEQVVFGHSVLDRPLITDKVIGIDGGACFGRQLHAYVFPERQVVTVQAGADHGRGRRGTQAANVLLYPIHDGVSTYS